MLALCDQTFGHLIEAIGDIERTVSDPLERVSRLARRTPVLASPIPTSTGWFPGPQHPQIDYARSAIARRPTTRPSPASVAPGLQRLVEFLSKLEASGAESAPTRRILAPNSAGWACTALWPR